MKILLFLLFTGSLLAQTSNVVHPSGGWAEHHALVVSNGQSSHSVIDVPAFCDQAGNLEANSLWSKSWMAAGYPETTEGTIILYNTTNGYYTRLRPSVPSGNIDLWLPAYASGLVGTDSSGSILGGTSVVGANATNAINIVSDWDTSGAPEMLHLEVNDTASHSASRLISGVVNFVEVLAIDKFGNTATSGSVCSKSATAGVGYMTGAGGAVTQVTSITTGVTLNKICGNITTVSSTLAAGGTATFTLTDSAIAANDVVNASIKTYSGTGLPTVHVTQTGSGTCSLTLHNIGGAALNASVTLNFAVTKSTGA